MSGNMVLDQTYLLIDVIFALKMVCEKGCEFNKKILCSPY